MTALFCGLMSLGVELDPSYTPCLFDVLLKTQLSVFWEGKLELLRGDVKILLSHLVTFCKRRLVRFCGSVTSLPHVRLKVTPDDDIRLLILYTLMSFCKL